MLSPEVWNFKAPESTFTTKTLNPNDNIHLNTIRNFVYTHLVSVILPDVSKVPPSLSAALTNDCDYYKLSEVKLSEFLTRDFISNFVNIGNLYALSVDTRIDCDNCASVTPQGQLILNLDKCTYQSLGLEGIVSHFHARTKERYIVTIDIKAKHFKPGKPNYERIKQCLESLVLSFIVTWEPHKEDVCPSSIAKYFHDFGYQTKLCRIEHNTHTLYSVKVPSLANDNHWEVVEWLGMVALDGNLKDGGPDNYVTTYETPEPNDKVGQVKFLQWRGLFTTNQVTNLFEELRKVAKSDWVAMYVQGFSDSTVAWKGEEHHYYTNGDNSYVFMLTGQHLVQCVQKCSRKRYNNKRKTRPS